MISDTYGLINNLISRNNEVISVKNSIKKEINVITDTNTQALWFKIAKLIIMVSTFIGFTFLYDILVAIIWFILLFIFGLHLTRRLKRKEDFLVAGRTLTAPILVGTLLATWIGSGDIFSASDISYNHGYSSLIGSSGGWLGIIIVFFIAFLR